MSWITPHTFFGMLPRSFPWTKILSSSLLDTLIGDYSVSTWTTKILHTYGFSGNNMGMLQSDIYGYVVSSKECLQTCIALRQACTSRRANIYVGVRGTIMGGKGIRTYIHIDIFSIKGTNLCMFMWHAPPSFFYLTFLG